MGNTQPLSFSVNAGLHPQMGNQVFAKINIRYQGDVVEATPHLVLTLDCSGSMFDKIEELRKDVKLFINRLNSGVFISIVTFSGHNQAHLVIGATDCTVAGKKKLCDAVDREVRVMGCTVFSEALNIAVQSTLHTPKPVNHMVVLFTDGWPVATQWSEAEEISKAINQVQTMRHRGIGLSCLGYGSQYNGQLLLNLMGECGNNGVLEHMDVLGGNLNQLISKILDITSGTKFGRIDFSIKGGKEAFKVVPQTASVGFDGQVGFNGLPNGEATVFIEMGSFNGSSLQILGTFDGESISTEVVVEPLDPEICRDFIVGKASVAMYKGDNVEASTLFSLLGNQELAYRAGASNTATEKRRFANQLGYYYNNREWIGAGLKDHGPNRCGVNAMRLIAEGCENNAVVIRVDSYRRTGLRNIKKGVVSGKNNPVLVTKVTSNAERMNFGFTTVDDGAKVATEQGFRPFSDFKTYLVILDGEYHNGAEFSASFTDKSWFDKLQDAGVIFENATYKMGEFYRLLFNADLPVVSPNFARPANLGLVHLLREEVDLKNKQKALNAKVKLLREADLTVEYAPAPKQTKDESQVVDTYEAQFCEYKIMGYKGLLAPDYSSLDYDGAVAELTKVKRRLNQVRFMSRLIRTACELTGSQSIKWFKVDGRANKTINQACLEGFTIQRDTWSEMVEFS